MFAALKKINAFADFSFWLSLTCDGSKFVWADGTEAEYTNFASMFFIDFLWDLLRWLTRLKDLVGRELSLQHCLCFQPTTHARNPQRIVVTTSTNIICGTRPKILHLSTTTQSITSSARDCIDHVSVLPLL